MSKKTVAWLLADPAGWTLFAWFLLMSASTALLMDYLIGGRR